MNNSVFGKTMENVDKRVDVKLITKWDNVGKRLGANSLISKPNFHSRSVIHENLVVIQMNRLKVKYDKPIYVGFSILDLSKTLMYDFHYNVMKVKYGDKLHLLYTDTDSLIYEFETNDLYEDINRSLSYFDTSDYPDDNQYNIPRVNKKVLGKFKDECSGKLLLEFVGTKSKSYCIITEDDIVKKIKGIKKNVVANEVTANDFRDCINKPSTSLLKKMYCFRSDKHFIYTQLINKITLTSDDDKRFIIPNSSTTLAWGNKRIDDYFFI